MPFKIAFIGAGSLVFARTLFTDIMSVPEFHDIQISFTDINPDNLEKPGNYASGIWTPTTFPSPSRPPRTGERLSETPGTLSTACG